VPESDSPTRRASDFTDDGQLPTVNDAWQRAGLAHKRIGVLETDLDKIKRAFLKDDLGTPDIDGHRTAHAELKEAAKLVKEYKVGMTKDLLKTIAATIGGIFLAGLFQYFRNN
jgi:hypothetical protein